MRHPRYLFQPSIDRDSAPRPIRAESGVDMARFQDPLEFTRSPERMHNKQLFDSSRWQQDPSSSSVEPQVPSSCTGENARTTVLTSSRSYFKFPDPPAIIPEYPLPVFFCVPPTQRTSSEERCRGKLNKFGQLPNWENEMMEQDIWPESFCKTRRMEQQKYLEPSSSSDIIHHPLPVYFRVKPALRTYESKKRGRKSRTLFTDLQLRVMEKVFSEQRYLDSTNRAKLAHILGLSEAQVKTWFQNRRMKWKKKVAKTGEKPDSSTATKKAQETEPAETLL